MDTRNGHIYNFFEDIPIQDREYCKEMNIPPTEKQRFNNKVSRNDNCPCGSGKKFKKCCMMKFRV